MNDEWGCPEVWRVLFCGKSLKSETAHFYIYMRILAQVTWHFKFFLSIFSFLIVCFRLYFIHFRFNSGLERLVIYIIQFLFSDTAR